MLPGIYKDERKLLPCLNLMVDSLVMQLAALPLVKQAVA
jgi:hypothetical protein